jgi:hydroxyethylthiazole kinase
MFEEILARIGQRAPMIHCITNFVTVNDCANIILACGGRPTMAHHPGEAAQITEKGQALVLNMGTMNDTDSMFLAGMRSNELGHPVILDPVGVGGSDLRKQTFRSLSETVHFSVIRGNASEIRFIATGTGAASGVDAADCDRITEENVRTVAKMACELAERLDCVIVVSGPIDIVADQERACLVRNGRPIMARITGSGCMSTALIGAFVGANPEEPFEAALAAVTAMGVGGERAEEKTNAEGGGTMTFRMHLIDQISLLTPEGLDERARLERLERKDL